MSAGMIAAAHIAAKQIRDNMYGGSSSSSVSSIYHREQLALTNALMQCADLTDVPTVTEDIYPNTNAYARFNTSCANCEHSKVFKFIKEKGPVLVCLLKLAEFEVMDSIVDNEHLCSNYATRPEADYKCCGCCGGV